MDELIELPQRNQKIWRYIEYDKFADLILSRTLYCRRLDKLPDALEGLLSAGNFRQMTPVREAFHNGYDIKGDRDQEILQSELMRRVHFVNCWHLSDSESRTMWRLYAPRSESVVIVSRVGRLCAYARFCVRQRVGHMIVSKVKYVDFDFQRPDWVCWGPALFKDLAYRVEREIRLVTIPNCDPRRIANVDFVRIPFDPTPLIEAVILHPHAYSGFCQAIRELVRQHLPLVPIATSSTSRLW